MWTHRRPVDIDIRPVGDRVLGAHLIATRHPVDRANGAHRHPLLLQQQLE
jgi:hypothetical protein